MVRIMGITPHMKIKLLREMRKRIRAHQLGEEREQ